MCEFSIKRLPVPLATAVTFQVNTNSRLLRNSEYISNLLKFGVNSCVLEQMSCSVHYVGRWGVEPLLSGSLEFGLEIALVSLLLVLPRVHPSLVAVMIFCSSSITLGIIFVTSISSKVVCWDVL